MSAESEPDQPEPIRLAPRRSGEETAYLYGAHRVTLSAYDARHAPNVEGYRILGVVGQGGMGIVYRAYQAKLNRIVALKVLPAMIGRANPQAVVRFRREANAAARLHHTNIIPIYDFGETQHAYFYAMELVDGLPLDEVIARLGVTDVTNASMPQFSQALQALWADSDRAAQAATRRALESGRSSDDSSGGSDAPTFAAASSAPGRGRVYFHQVARWIADAADALQYAHEHGITHRDIKPGNLILSVDGRIMIADFGLALVAGEQAVTMTGSMLGTLRYMSPEQALANRAQTDHRADIWSLGAVLYELLTLQPAFPGADQKEVLGHILTREPTPPRKVVAGVPRELEVICQKAIEKAPTDRYATARAMADDLRRFINDLPIAAKPPGPIGRAIKFVRRHKAGVASVTALVAVLLLALTAMMLRSSFRRNRAQRLESLIKQGGVELAARNWEAAESAFNEALQIRPDCARAFFNLAIMKKDQYNRLGASASGRLLEEADELCRRGLEIESKNVGGLNTHGVILKKLERYDEAQAAYARAVDLDPGLFTAWDNLAIVFAHQGDLAKAEAHELKATELAGTNDKYAAYCWRNLASLWLHSGKPGVSEAVEKAITANDLDADNWLVSALSKLRSGDYRAALDDIKYADRLAKGGYGRVKRILAMAHLRTGEYADAIKQADAAIGLGDTTCINELTKATSHAGLRDWDAARAALRTATERWPPALINEHAVVVNSDRGVLWFDTAAELMRFRAEVSALIEATPHARP